MNRQDGGGGGWGGGEGGGEGGGCESPEIFSLPCPFILTFGMFVLLRADTHRISRCHANKS